ncbi:Transcriptional regulator, MarR family [Nostocoides japonicum T1-X7]|uniref:Transcriptional regulator, MarR family n=1 Tax=Nostocoides japonicum T1-X7 TaxID=1194083 RepID=A0A077LXS9_9MICO|nr:MarR family transcriptional regulator [Tetrasphaera japonica]CCH77687.1 Transcriptional regulator, MarR family [Tetrasphaera japonica T1-X7]
MPAGPQDVDLANTLLRTVARLNRWTNRRAELPVPAAQARVLSLLDDLGASRVGDLARADSTSQPTMTVQVDRLERLGLVTRQPDPDDSRAVLVMLTEAGAATIADIREARGRILAPVVDGLDPPARAALADATGTLVRLVETLPPIP